MCQHEMMEVSRISEKGRREEHKYPHVSLIGDKANKAGLFHMGE